jgi:spore coat polysaccharide biosynthesis protein SpsF (cytidylyltransferase family)
MKTITIVQARMSSNRLPGKVLRLVEGKTLLAYLLESLKQCNSLGQIVVATSLEASDDPIAAACRGIGVLCFRGPLENVAERFRMLLDVCPCDRFVRANGDSPLLDHRLVDQGVGLFQSGNYDLVTNTQPRTFPRGQSVEVVRTDVFQEACRRMTEPEDKEHVTRFFYRHASEFRIHNFESGRDFGGLHMAVDEQRDFEAFEAAVRRMNKPHWKYALDELAGLYRGGVHQSAEARA